MPFLLSFLKATSLPSQLPQGSLHHPAAWARDGQAAALKLCKRILAPGILPNTVFASQCASGMCICLTCQSRNEGRQKFSIYRTSVPNHSLNLLWG